jgi:predicted nucleic acid-binding protein
MQILLDTSLLYALNDADDQNHAKAVNFLGDLTSSLYLPVPVLPELCYLLHSRLGTIDASDLLRIAEILIEYADANLDFTDAALIALAERQGFERIATFDRRDFSLVRPRHCAAFELLP